MQAKHILFIFLLNITFTILAGNDQDNDFHRIQIGVNFSPDYCYRVLIGDDYAISRRNEREEAQFGYTGGLVVNFNLNKVSGIESGVQYSNKGFSEKIYVSVDGFDYSYEYYLRDIYRFHYIEVPLKARFVTGERKVRFLLSIGVITGFLMRAATQYRYEKTGTWQNNSENYNRLNFFLTGSIGIDYKVTPKSNIRIDPVFRYGLLNTVKSKDVNNDPISEHLWSAGVNVSYLVGIK